ncbi:hypothetical protein SDC9_112696 [bioreactor metagenome]|uniref:Uncharacterized protein n=1 Tax=bioreactor metagenome TaxID=1076179 RepID=A0A645BVJ8_9ZZZZ
MLCIVSLIEVVSELPTVTMAITEPMPIIIPNIVRNERILLVLRLLSESKMLSQMFINQFPLSLFDDLSVVNFQDPVTLFR